jgi:glycosyltransferase involved in cell wall biosynthesis
MTFTIAIPTYNNAKSIHLAIESAINQNFTQEYEILVVNNKCTDNTAEILEKYKSYIRIIENHETVSMWENHNICLKKSKGDYVIFCHSDDELLFDALKKYYDKLKERDFPEKYVLWGRSMFRDFYNNWKSSGFSLNQIASGINSLDVFFNGGLTPSGTCYHKNSFLKLDGFIIVNYKLAPSDLVTMLKLSINNFEFEMADRIFFKRESASTAFGIDYKYNNKKKSFIDAIVCLKRDLSDKNFLIFLERVKSSHNFSPFLFLALIENKYIKGRDLKIKLLLEVIKNPTCIRRIEVRKMFLA